MRKDDGRAIPNFIAQALADESITIYGDGSQTRSFCYISNMVDGICKMIFSDKAKGETLENVSELFQDRFTGIDNR